MRHPVIDMVESLSSRSCYRVTGRRISWCGLAYEARCWPVVLLLDLLAVVLMALILGRPRWHHCRRSAEWWRGRG